MVGSQARKNKEQNPVSNEDVHNPDILRATIAALEEQIQGNYPTHDAAIKEAIAKLKEQLKDAKGGNPNTQKRPLSSRPWR